MINLKEQLPERLNFFLVHHGDEDTKRRHSNFGHTPVLQQIDHDSIVKLLFLIGLQVDLLGWEFAEPGVSEGVLRRYPRILILLQQLHNQILGFMTDIGPVWTKKEHWCAYNVILDSSEAERI